MADNYVRVIVEIEQLDSGMKNMRAFAQECNKVNGTTINVNVRTGSLNQATSKVYELADAIKQVSSMMSSVGTTAAGFAESIGGAFSGMANIFKTDILSQIGQTLTRLGTEYVTSNLSAITSRYDIMTTFASYMEAVGVSSEEANRALNKVDQTIRGIPIGLDEAAFRLRRYEMYLDDLDRATDLTIGIQKAITAGGASDAMKTNAYTQIDRLLATGKLGQSRQWISLFNGLGVSLRYLKEELALDPTMSMQQVASDLAKGAISADEFLRAIERLAYNEDLDELLNIYKGTIEAWVSNIKNAVKRGGQAILKAFSESLGGQDITDLLHNVRDWIDSIAASASNFIRNHPELITGAKELFNGARELFGRIDIAAIISGVMTNLGRLLDMIERIADAFPDGFFEEFVSFAITLAGPLSKVFELVKSGGAFMIAIFERFKEMDLSILIDAIVKQVESLVNIFTKLLNIFSDEALANIIAWGLTKGRLFAGVVEKIGSVLQGIALFKFTGLASVFKSIGSGLRELGEAITFYDSLNAIFNPGSFGLLNSIASTGGVVAYVGASIGTAISWVNKMEAAADAANDEMLAGMRESVSTSEELIGGLQDMEKTTSASAQNIEMRFKSASAALEQMKGAFDRGDIDSLREYADIIYEMSGLEFGYISDAGLSAEQEELMLTAQAWLDYAEAKEYATLYKPAIEEGQQDIIKLRAERATLDGEINEKRKEVSYLETAADWYGKYQSNQMLDQTGTEGDRYYIPLAIQKSIRENEEYYATASRRVHDINGEIAEAEEVLEDVDKRLDHSERYVRNLEDAYSDAAKTQKTYNEYAEDTADALEGIEEVAEKMPEVLSGTESKILDIANAYATLKEAAEDSLQAQVTGFEELEAAETVSAEKLLENYMSQLEFINNLQENWLILADYLRNGDEYGIGEILSELVNDPIGNAGITQGIVDALVGGDVETLAQLGVASATRAMENALDNELPNYIKLLAKYGADVDEWAATELVDNLPLATWVKGDLDAAEEYLKTWGSLEGFQYFLEGVTPTSVNWDEIEMHTVSLGEQLDGIGEQLGVLPESAEQAAEGLSDAMESVTFHAAMEQANRVREEMEALPPSGVDAAYGLNTAMETVTFRAAINEAQTLLNTINALPTYKQVQIDIQTNRLQSVYGTMDDAFIAGNYARGGIIFKPHGTDTVPAMLTPGEYVMTRQAVQAAGLPILEAINRMDYGAAYDNLVSVMGQTARIGQGTVNNYYYSNDNHANVTINNHGGAGQGYSQRKAYRWASAL